jgi:N-acetyl-anhydromuramyl-L-alanine amidase AmpD
MNKDTIVIHCTDTYARMDIDAARIAYWHKLRGWRANGYNFVIRRCGALEIGRDLDDDWDAVEEIGAHARGYNNRSIGVALVGGKADDGRPEANFTDEQMITLKALVGIFRSLIPGVSVLGHRDLPGVTKACPCFDVEAWMQTGKLTN